MKSAVRATCVALLALAGCGRLRYRGVDAAVDGAELDVLGHDTADDAGRDTRAGDVAVDSAGDAGTPPDSGLDTSLDATRDAASEDGGRDAGNVDAGMDSSADAYIAPGADGGRDAGNDVGIDGGRDAGNDVGIDGGRDAGMDAGRDAGRDASFDGGRDVGADAPPPCSIEWHHWVAGPEDDHITALHVSDRVILNVAGERVAEQPCPGRACSIALQPVSGDVMGLYTSGGRPATMVEPAWWTLTGSADVFSLQRLGTDVARILTRPGGAGSGVFLVGGLGRLAYVVGVEGPVTIEPGGESYPLVDIGIVIGLGAMGEHTLSIDGPGLTAATNATMTQDGGLDVWLVNWGTAATPICHPGGCIPPNGTGGVRIDPGGAIRHTLGTSANTRGGFLEDDSAIVVDYSSRSVARLDPGGAERWRHDFPATDFGIAAAGNTAVLLGRAPAGAEYRDHLLAEVDEEAVAVRIDIESGEVLEVHRFGASTSVPIAAVAQDGAIYVAAHVREEPSALCAPVPGYEASQDALLIRLAPR